MNIGVFECLVCARYYYSLATKGYAIGGFCIFCHNIQNLLSTCRRRNFWLTYKLHHSDTALLCSDLVY